MPDPRVTGEKLATAALCDTFRGKMPRRDELFNQCCRVLHDVSERLRPELGNRGRVAAVDDQLP
jgi:hypothetical protein